MRKNVTNWTHNEITNNYWKGFFCDILNKQG